jgi:hypothetical protein
MQPAQGTQDRGYETTMLAHPVRSLLRWPIRSCPGQYNASVSGRFRGSHHYLRKPGANSLAGMIIEQFAAVLGLRTS